MSSSGDDSRVAFRYRPYSSVAEANSYTRSFKRSNNAHNQVAAGQTASNATYFAAATRYSNTSEEKRSNNPIQKDPRVARNANEPSSVDTAQSQYSNSVVMQSVSSGKSARKSRPNPNVAEIEQPSKYLALDSATLSDVAQSASWPNFANPMALPFYSVDQNSLALASAASLGSLGTSAMLGVGSYVDPLATLLYQQQVQQQQQQLAAASCNQQMYQEFFNTLYDKIITEFPRSQNQIVPTQTPLGLLPPPWMVYNMTLSHSAANKQAGNYYPPPIVTPAGNLPLFAPRNCSGNEASQRKTMF